MKEKVMFNRIMATAAALTVCGAFPAFAAATPSIPPQFQGRWVDPDLSGSDFASACADSALVIDDEGTSVEGRGTASMCEARKVTVGGASTTVVALCGDLFAGRTRATLRFGLEDNNRSLVETARYGKGAPIVSRYKRCPAN